MAALSPTAIGAELGDAPARLSALAERSLLLDCAQYEQRRIVVGERGHILVSENGGDRWQQVASPSQATLTAITLIDKQHAWAVGHDLSVLYSSDGGQSWALQHRAPEEDRPLLDVWFTDAKQGIAVGAYGLLMRTRDGGQNWQLDELLVDNPDTEELLPDEEPLPPDFHLNALLEGDDGSLYLAAEAGLLYRSDNRGDSWRELPSPYHGSFFGLHSLPDGGLLAFGLRGHLFRSDDRGESWRQLETGSDALLMKALQRGRSTYIAGLGGTLLRSDDGEHFQRLPNLGRQAYTCLMSAPDALIASGEGGLHRLPLEAAP